MNTKTINRWLVAIMGTVLQLVLGTVYAWSFFQRPVMEAFGWSNVQTMWIFSIAILTLGLTSALGGYMLPRFGPKKLAVTGAILYGAGYIISAFAMSINSLPLFYLGFGIVGGIGLGLGYVTPVATASKWFPDKKGLVTGMVIMGFGFGALLMSKVIAPVTISMMDGSLVNAFYMIGVIMLILGTPAAFFMVNPPDGFVPEGYTPPVKTAAQQASDDGLTVGKVLMSSKFFAMWVIFFMNIAAGIIFIGWQSPMLQDLLSMANPELDLATLAAAGATLIAISSLFNGVGRMFWGGISDKIGRIQTFRLILASQLLVFFVLMFSSSPWIFMVLVCYVLLCYGGGFGTMPSFVLDIFGAKLMPVVYGTILTAWSLAGIAGPQIAAFIKDNYPETASFNTFLAGASLLGIGLLVSLFLNNRPFESKTQ